MSDIPRIGPAGGSSKGPFGQEGELTIKISPNREKGIVVVQFGTPVTGLGLDEVSAKFLVRALWNAIEKMGWRDYE